MKTPCRLGGGYQHSGGTFSLHLQGSSIPGNLNKKLICFVELLPSTSSMKWSGEIKEHWHKCWDNTVNWAKIATSQTPGNAPLVIIFSETLVKQSFDVRFSHSYWPVLLLAGRSPDAYSLATWYPCSKVLCVRTGSMGLMDLPVRDKPHAELLRNILATAALHTKHTPLTPFPYNNPSAMGTRVHHFQLVTPTVPTYAGGKLNRTYTRLSCRKVAYTWYDVSLFVEQTNFNNDICN
jgi:hypothetical protein